MVIAGGDSYTLINPSADFGNLFYSWLDKVDAGMPNLGKPKIFPFAIFWFVGKKIGLSLPGLQVLWTTLLFTLPGVFIFFLIKKIYRSSERTGDLAGLVGAIFYMFNYLVIVDAFGSVLRLVLTFLPVMFYFWIKGLEEKGGLIKYSIFFALTSLFYASSNVNFPAVSPIYLILLVYFFYYVFVGKKVKQSLLFAVISFILLFLVNLWWETDFYFSLIRASKGIIAGVREYEFLASTPMFESFRTMGFWAFLQQFNGKTLLPFALSYYRFPLLLLTFLIPILSFSSLLFKTKNNYKYFFAVLALLGVFLAKGSNPPFGLFYKFLYDNFPPFSSFREPFAKFTLVSVFAFSVLLGFFTEDFYTFLKKRKKIIASWLPIITVLVILVNSYPLLSRRHIQDESWYQDSRYSLYVKIPDYWLRLGKWFESRDPVSRIMVFPKNYYGQIYNWESGISTAGPAAIPLLPNPIIFHSPRIALSEENRLANLVYQVLYLGEKADLFPYFDLFNIGYALQQNDATPYNEAGVFDPLIMKKILESQSFLKPEADFDQLKVYSVQNASPSKQIYSPGELIYVLGKLEGFPDIFSFTQYNSKFSYYFSEDQPENNDLMKKASSTVFINLKDKLESKSDAGEFIYKFNVPRDSAYNLLINGNLFGGISQNDMAKYYLRLDGSYLRNLEYLGSWQVAQTGILKEGFSILQTNLPVEVIKKEFLTSPFWLVEDKEVKNSINPPAISFTKVNPSKYEIQIKEQGVSPYLLVFSEAYHPEWKIYYKNKEINADHFIVNGYANGWYIGKEAVLSGNGNYSLELIYRPQKFANAGMAISAVTIFILVTIVLISYFSKAM